MRSDQLTSAARLRHSQWVGRVVAATAFTLVLASCGSSDTDQDPATDEGPTNSVESSVPSEDDTKPEATEPPETSPPTVTEPPPLDPASPDYPTVPPPAPPVTYPDGSSFEPIVPAPTTSYPR